MPLVSKVSKNVINLSPNPIYRRQIDKMSKDMKKTDQYLSLILQKNQQPDLSVVAAQHGGGAHRPQPTEIPISHKNDPQSLENKLRLDRKHSNDALKQHKKNLKRMDIANLYGRPRLRSKLGLQQPEGDASASSQMMQASESLPNIFQAKNGNSASRRNFELSESAHDFQVQQQNTNKQLTRNTIDVHKLSMTDPHKKSSIGFNDGYEQP